LLGLAPCLLELPELALHRAPFRFLVQCHLERETLYLRQAEQPIRWHIAHGRETPNGFIRSTRHDSSRQREVLQVAFRALTLLQLAYGVGDRVLRATVPVDLRHERRRDAHGFLALEAPSAGLVAEVDGNRSIDAGYERCLGQVAESHAKNVLIAGADACDDAARIPFHGRPCETGQHPSQAADSNAGYDATGDDRTD